MTGQRAAYIGSTALVKIVVESGSTLSILVIAGTLGQEAVATYSVCLAAIWLASIIFSNGVSVMLRRNFVLHPEVPALTIYRRAQSAVFRSPRQYLVTAIALILLAGYIGWTIGAEGVVLMGLMIPLFAILSFQSIKIEYHKAVGQSVRASFFEPGLLHLAITGLILAATWMGTRSLIPIFSAGFVGFLAVAVFLVAYIWNKKAGDSAVRTTNAQRKILANTLLMFVFRNGFPLFFAAFMAIADLGHFRTEERLFYFLLFFYFLFETLGMKSVIAAYSAENSATAPRFYRRSVAQLFLLGLVVALAMYAALSSEVLAGVVAYDWTGDLTLFMAIATPFYFVTYFNTLVLNLLGHHGSVIWSVLLGSVAFIAGAYILYPLFGIDGVRTAYLGGGILSSGFSGATLLYVQRSSRPAPEAASDP